MPAESRDLFGPEQNERKSSTTFLQQRMCAFPRDEQFHCNQCNNLKFICQRTEIFVCRYRNPVDPGLQFKCRLHIQLWPYRAVCERKW